MPPRVFPGLPPNPQGTWQYWIPAPRFRAGRYGDIAGWAVVGKALQKTRCKKETARQIK